MIIGPRPGWLASADAELDRLGPWLPPRPARKRRPVCVLARTRKRDDLPRRMGLVVLERIDGLGLVRVRPLVGDLLATDLGTPPPITWLVCLLRHSSGPEFARPLPGAWGNTILDALSRCPDRTFCT